MPPTDVPIGAARSRTHTHSGASGSAALPQVTDPGPRSSLLRIMLIWLAANLVVTTLLTGTLFVPGVRFGEAVLWIVVGTVLGASVLTVVAVMGVRTGLSTMMLTRASFGLRGAIVPSAANLIILMGWSWVQAMLAGISLNWLIHAWTGYSNPVLFSAICEAVVVALAIFGHAGIARLEPWLGAAILAFMAYVFATAFSFAPPAAYMAIPADASVGMDGAAVFDIVFATAISWTVLSADLTRSAVTPRAGAIGAGLGYTVSTLASMLLGAVAAGYLLLRFDIIAPFDPVALITAFGPALALVMFLSVMATNTMVVYGMTLSAQHALPLAKPLPFVPTALVIGAASVIGSTWLGLLESFTAFLSTIGALFIPVFAIMIVDYFFVRRSEYSSDIMAHTGGAYWFRAGWHPSAIVAWALGGASYWILAYVLPTPVGAALPALLITALLYGCTAGLPRVRSLFARR